MKLVGKPYAGKSHVRFDEGVRRSGFVLTPRSTLPVKKEQCTDVFHRKVYR